MKMSANFLKITMLVGTSALLAACGSKQGSEADFSSRSPVKEVVSTNTKVAWAYCNKASGKEFGAQNKAWIENNQVTRFDFIKAKLTLPETFLTNGNYVQVYRWKANSAGQTYMDTTPLQFRLVSNSGSTLTDYMNALSWSKVTQPASALNLKTAKDFFNQVQLVVDVRDPYAEFDAIKVVVYNSANQPVDQLDMLIPVFSADPAAYAKESDGSTRATVLKNIHPLKSMLGQSWTPEHYQTLVEGFCF